MIADVMFGTAIQLFIVILVILTFINWGVGIFWDYTILDRLVIYMMGSNVEKVRKNKHE